MVAGMTPSTVSWEFVSAIHQAGYHVELAGGGLPKQNLFKEAMEKYVLRLIETVAFIDSS
jgi:fatty acid synthase subunit beta